MVAGGVKIAGGIHTFFRLRLLTVFYLLIGPLRVFADQLEEDVVHRRDLFGKSAHLHLAGQIADQLVARGVAVSLEQVGVDTCALLLANYVKGTVWLHREHVGRLKLIEARAVGLLDLPHVALEHHLGVVDERDVVADLLHAGHVVGREDDGVSLLLELKNLLLELLGVDRVEARERLVEDEQVGLVEDGDDKLHLLRHSLGQFFEFAVPPGHDAKLPKPLLEAGLGLAPCEPFESGQIDRLLAHLHLSIESTLLGQIADAGHVGGLHLPSVEDHLATVGSSDAVEDTDQGGLARTVGTKESEDAATTHGQRDIAERDVTVERLGDISHFNKILHLYCLRA